MNPSPQAKAASATRPRPSTGRAARRAAPVRDAIASTCRLLRVLAFVSGALSLPGCQKAGHAPVLQASAPEVQPSDAQFDFQKARIENSQGTFYEVAITNKAQATTVERVSVNDGACAAHVMPTVQGQQLSLSLPMTLYSGAQMVIHATCDPKRIAVKTEQGIFRGSWSHESSPGRPG